MNTDSLTSKLQNLILIYQKRLSNEKYKILSHFTNYILSTIILLMFPEQKKKKTSKLFFQAYVFCEDSGVFHY